LNKKIIIIWLITLLVILLTTTTIVVIVVRKERRGSLPTISNPSLGRGPGQYNHHGAVLLPNPQLSPGEVRTTDVYAVCHERTQTYRETSESLKNRVYGRYNVRPHEGVCVDTIRVTHGTSKHPAHKIREACEIDHIIALELGGADTEANLFPQPYNPPSGIGAHAKDRVENYLHHQVCDHGFSLPLAQQQIASDWYQVYQDAHLQ
jgi:hypothetical protein